MIVLLIEITVIARKNVLQVLVISKLVEGLEKYFKNIL